MMKLLAVNTPHISILQQVLFDEQYALFSQEGLNVLGVDEDVNKISFKRWLGHKTSYQDLVFQTEVEAFSFYSSYAKSRGFSIKKGHAYIDIKNKKNAIPYYLNYMSHNKQGLKVVRKMKVGVVSMKKGDVSKKKVCERPIPLASIPPVHNDIECESPPECKQINKQKKLTTPQAYKKKRKRIRKPSRFLLSPYDGHVVESNTKNTDKNLVTYIWDWQQNP
ncbi:hypothetical protein LIER_28295 [Lithospermum erythrorhizon]|uniref:Uncharacterized protein n=1 Tax=Lithospermum erythrorhizon TaxID=34254 RepID=A0AAV3RJC5_LITER